MSWTELEMWRWSDQRRDYDTSPAQRVEPLPPRTAHRLDPCRGHSCSAGFRVRPGHDAEFGECGEQRPHAQLDGNHAVGELCPAQHSNVATDTYSLRGCS